MSPDRTQRLIGELARDLAPVQRVPRLRVSVAMVVGIVAATALIAFWMQGLRPNLADALRFDPLFGGVFVGLVLTGVGAALAAVAAATPGRQRVVRAGAATGLVGGLGALALCLVGVAGAGFDAGSPLSSDRMCLGQVFRLAILPSVALAVVLARGWTSSPLAAAALALVAGVALGAMVTHLLCVFGGARHLLLGHLSGLLLFTGLGVVPLATLLRHLARAR